MIKCCLGASHYQLKSIGQSQNRLENQAGKDETEFMRRRQTTEEGGRVPVRLQVSSMSYQKLSQPAPHIQMHVYCTCSVYPRCQRSKPGAFFTAFHFNSGLIYSKVSYHQICHHLQMRADFHIAAVFGMKNNLS